MLTEVEGRPFDGLAGPARVVSVSVTGGVMPQFALPMPPRWVVAQHRPQLADRPWRVAGGHRPLIKRRNTMTNILHGLPRAHYRPNCMRIPCNG